MSCSMVGVDQRKGMCSTKSSDQAVWRVPKFGESAAAGLVKALCQGVKCAPGPQARVTLTQGPLGMLLLLFSFLTELILK